jgi:hypothetical protein
MWNFIKYVTDQGQDYKAGYMASIGGEKCINRCGGKTRIKETTWNTNSYMGR